MDIFCSYMLTFILVIVTVLVYMGLDYLLKETGIKYWIIAIIVMSVDVVIILCAVEKFRY